MNVPIARQRTAAAFTSRLKSAKEADLDLLTSTARNIKHNCIRPAKEIKIMSSTRLHPTGSADPEQSRSALFVDYVVVSTKSAIQWRQWNEQERTIRRNHLSNLLEDHDAEQRAQARKRKRPWRSKVSRDLVAPNALMEAYDCDRKLQEVLLKARNHMVKETRELYELASDFLSEPLRPDLPTFSGEFFFALQTCIDSSVQIDCLKRQLQALDTELTCSLNLVSDTRDRLASLVESMDTEDDDYIETVKDLYVTLARLLLRHDAVVEARRREQDLLGMREQILWDRENELYLDKALPCLQEHGILCEEEEALQGDEDNAVPSSPNPGEGKNHTVEEAKEDTHDYYKDYSDAFDSWQAKETALEDIRKSYRDEFLGFFAKHPHATLTDFDHLYFRRITKARREAGQAQDLVEEYTQVCKAHKLLPKTSNFSDNSRDGFTGDSAPEFRLERARTTRRHEINEWLEDVPESGLVNPLRHAPRAPSERIQNVKAVEFEDVDHGDAGYMIDEDDIKSKKRKLQRWRKECEELRKSLLIFDDGCWAHWCR